MQRGRKAELKRLAADVRREVGFSVDEPIDPRAIAVAYGFSVFTLEEAGLGPGELETARQSLAERWSGAVVSDGRRAIILENEFHPAGRRNATVGHEVAHILLEHPLSMRVLAERSCGAGKELEVEADELSGELLLPRDAVVRAAIRGASIPQIAARYGVSEAFTVWRYNMSGASRILRSRKTSEGSN
jgi:hypothetical protein